MKSSALLHHLSALLLAAAASVSADTTLTASGNWVGGTWSDGVPSGNKNATLAAGVSGTANGIVPNWKGKLTLEPGSQLTVSGNTSDFIALAGLLLTLGLLRRRRP